MASGVCDYSALISRARVLEFEACRNDFMYFIRHYCVIEDKDAYGGVIKFEPWGAQLVLLRSVHEHKLNIILKARQLGITWIVLMYGVWDLVFHSGHTVIALSKTEDDAKELVRRAGVIVRGCSGLLSGGGVCCEVFASQIRFRFADGGAESYFKSFPATEEAGRSFTGNILMLDEWAFQEYARKIFNAAFPTINRPDGGKVIGLSTIKRGTFFEEKWQDPRSGFNKLFLGAFADPRRTQAWYDATERVLGRRVLQEYPRTPEEALANMEGLFFTEFDLARHVVQPFSVPSGRRIYSVMDYGLDMLAHYKIAVDGSGVCYVFDEVYASDKVVSEAARLMLAADERADEFGVRSPFLVPSVRLAPPDLFAVNAQTGRSTAEAFRALGVRLVRVSNDRATGWLALKELLREGKLVISSRCVNLIRTMQCLMVDPDDPCDCLDEPHEYTHAPDALRYFAVWWVRGGEDKAADVVSVGSAQVWTRDMREDYARGSAVVRREMEIRYGMPPKVGGGF